MFFRKITSRSNGKEYTYLKLIENYREGEKVKQRVVANLGSLENLTPDKVQGLIAGLSRICGVSNKPSSLEAKKVLRYGEVLAVHRVWEMLQIPRAIEISVPEHTKDLNIPLLVELMAINQVVKPQNKQAISDWYRCLYLPGLDEKELLSHHFYRALDVLAKAKDAVERNIFTRLTGILPVSADLAFCRLTSGLFEPAPREELNPSSYGRYFLEDQNELEKVRFGIMVTRDGIPFGHRMFREDSGEWEFREVLDYLKGNFGIDRCIFTGERSVTANPSLEVLVAQGYEYLIGRKVIAGQDQDLVDREMSSGRKDFREVREDLWFKEVKDGDVRYLLCYNPQGAEQKKTFLEERLSAVEGELDAIRKSIDEKRQKGIKTVINKNTAVFKDEFCRKYFDWSYDEESMDFIYRRRENLLAREKNSAGMFILETNSRDLTGTEILDSYTRLVRLGDSLREIKNFEARPGKLYTELNISANILVCVLAIMLEEALERLVRRAGFNLNSRQTLDLLEEIKLTVNQLDDREVRSVTRIPEAQEQILRAIGVGVIQRTII